MSNFSYAIIKTVNDIAMLPNILAKAVNFVTHNGHKNISNKNISKTYGGFTNSDWEKVGNDMKRALISFEKQDSCSPKEPDNKTG